ncbi:SAM-dependent methyltransferase [Bacillus sp. V33-4]|uniref:SAM-dependent methyltransferase n=1 Tax=Bacillus sp. V33-4 TaxID=2054169 RepID=UPI0021559510|nr:class I SAM-dependent methyltransferase [Bacillus sp. V33-4]
MIALLISQLCKEKHFNEEWFLNCCEELQIAVHYHRKLWEWCFITQALTERGMLKEGKKGLGFGVGKEPLVSLFASRGCEVVATDIDFQIAKLLGWVDSNQHSNNLEDLNERKLCEPEQFSKLVTFEFMDMNEIDQKQHNNKYDFTWSSCSFEHLGTIERSKRFIMNQMHCLKPGGVAVHTTEFNLSSNEHTIESGATVILRKKDIESLVNDLREDGHSIEVDYTAGTGNIESFVDVPPYTSEIHLRLLLEQYVSTSIGLIIQKKNSDSV